MTDSFVCGLCSYFNTGDYARSRVLCTQDEDGVCGALLMYCKQTDSMQHLTFSSCELFLPANAFYCVTANQYVESADCCRMQIDESHPFCLDCAQGRMVISMMRGGSKRWEKSE